MSDLVAITLVPVEVFGAECSCHDHAQDMCRGWGYGLCDADSVGSDCNRAVGHIYRVADTPGPYRPGEACTVYVRQEDVPWFRKVWTDRERCDGAYIAGQPAEQGPPEIKAEGEGTRRGGARAPEGCYGRHRPFRV